MTTASATATVITPATLAAFVRAAGLRTGMPPEAADTLADALVLADMMGVHTHGTKLLAGYLRKLLAGGYRPDGTPRIVREGPAWAVVDGDAALGQIGCTMAMQLAVAKAKQVGIASVSLRNTGHIGAAGGYAILAARAGCIGLVVGNDAPSVVAPGSRRAVIGSNPLAWAAPRPDGEPLFLDIATAAVAGGKVYAAVARGEPIPADWLVGADGRPTTDGSLYPQHAALAPMAGHKGYGFALLAEILSGVLSGGAVVSQVGSWMADPPEAPSRHAAGFVAIDVGTICDRDAHAAAMERIVREIRAAPVADGVERVLLPGEREWSRTRAAAERGIPLPADVHQKLAAAAALVGIDPPA